MRQTPVTEADFCDLRGRILLILPDQDYFSQKNAAGPHPPDALMHEPRIAYVSGGHLTTVLQEEKFIETIRAFLPSLGSNADRREWQ